MVWSAVVEFPSGGCKMFLNTDSASGTWVELVYEQCKSLAGFQAQTALRSVSTAAWTGLWNGLTPTSRRLSERLLVRLRDAGAE